MKSRTCSKCGADYPKGHNQTTCVVCGEILPEKVRELKTILATRDRNWHKRQRAAASEKLETWLKRIKSIPTPYQTLTEEQWLEACSFFGGCAYCGSDDIDVRALFISFKQGGRYCNWNVVPSCPACQRHCKYSNSHNPFDYMDHRLHRNAGAAARERGWNLKNLGKIEEYLSSKIKVAANEPDEPTPRRTSVKVKGRVISVKEKGTKL